MLIYTLSIPAFRGMENEMANDAATTAVIESLDRSNVDPRFVKAVTTVLAPESLPSGFNFGAEVVKANADYFAEQQRKKTAESRADYERLCKDLAVALRRHGVWNVLAAFPDLLRDHAANDPEIVDGSDAEADYGFAANVLDAILPATDLRYGDTSSRTRRKEQLGAAVIALGQVKP